jgi:hypothetical protein
MTLYNRKKILSLGEQSNAILPGKIIFPFDIAEEERNGKGSVFSEEEILPYRERHPTPPIIFPSHAYETEKEPPLIKPSYSSRGISNIEFDAYLVFVEQILRNVLPQDLITALSMGKDQETIQKSVRSLHEKLPFITWNNPEMAPCTLCVSLLCPSESISGVGRYLCDIMDRWLVPGKRLNISSIRSLEFSFITYPEQTLFFHQTLIDIDSDQQLSTIQNNWENLRKQMRLSILAMRHARNAISLKTLSSEQKKAIIEENITSLLLCGDKFAGMRDLCHVGRLISYHYLFRKTLMLRILESPGERHLSIKLLKARLSASVNAKNDSTLLGIVGAMNVLKENELFEERHIEEAIAQCLPHVRKIENSFLFDRSNEPLRLFYFEIEKIDGGTFSIDEMKKLKKNLFHELKESVESVLHPLLMPRNDEEIIRSIVLLSQQLKYISDLPQVIISFNAQTEQSLQFTVILLRILQKGDLALPEILATISAHFKIEDLEVKQVGLLRKRYPKESSVFKLSLNKKKFLRRDFTIDLLKARQEVSLELKTIFKGIRDFNGGILSKQQEMFQELKSLISKTSSQKDFLIENFFYSITPPLKQTLIAPTSLKILFSLMQTALDTNYKKETFFLQGQFEADQLLIMAASPISCIKEELFSLLTRLNIPSSELSCTHVNAYGISCIGYIYENRDLNILKLFYSTLTSCLKTWQARIRKSTNP